MRGLVAGTFNVSLYDVETNALACTSKTLINSALSMGVSSEEARGGYGNFLIGRYYHTTSFGLTLEDQVWDLEYLAMNCGGAITADADVFVTEQVTVTTANKITVTDTPVDFTSTSGTIGWYKLSTESEEEFKVFTFNEKEGTVQGLEVGTVVCVRYLKTSTSARKFVVNSEFMPKIYHAVLTVSKLKAGGDGSSVSSATNIGQIMIDVPQYQLDGAQEFSLSSTGFASSSLSGQALVNFDSSAGCSSSGYYATITEEDYGVGEFDYVSNIVIPESDIELSVGDEASMEIWKMFSNGTNPSPISDNTVLTIASGTQATATVNASGVITAVAVGTSTIEVTVTDKTSLSATATVTVTA